jgi:hypothetical protein
MCYRPSREGYVSKAVRIREHLYAEIASLAKAEHRSLIAQLEVLLEQALRIESSGAAVGYAAGSGSVAQAVSPSSRETRREHDEPERAAPEDHFKPDPK